MRAGDRLGPYRLRHELGRGGQAIVHLAEDTRFERKVALKVFRDAKGSAQATGRAQQEARTLGRLDHPGICAVHDVGSDNGHAYVAMRYVEGETLAVRIARRRAAVDGSNARRGEREWIAEACRLVERVAHAVHAAHDAGVVHGDLKPGNVLISLAGEPVVLDFGLALLDDSTFASASKGAGTAAYLAPELVDTRLGLPDRRTDVYALAATLHECVTLAPPFEASTREGVLRAIVSEDQPSANGVRVPRDLAVVLATGMARGQDHRYQTALDLAEDLRRVREHLPIRARAAGPWLRLSRWARRRRRLASALVATTLVLVGGLAVTARLLAESRTALGELRRVVDVRSLPHLLDEEERERWPATPDALPALDAWLAEAEAILARAPRHRRETVALAASDTVELERFFERLPELESAVAAARRRRERAATLRAETVGANRALWEETIDEIADRERAPLYGGLRIEPQVGLVPLGRDLDSGLFEFAGVMTGDVPARELGGREVRPRESSGLTFVLLPGGTFRMGAAPPDPGHPVGSANVDPDVPFEDDEGPVHEVALDPFFLSKYEMTVAQWRRAFVFAPGPDSSGTLEAEGDLPLRNRSWEEAVALLERLDLDLPTEAQWEYGARGGTGTLWWTGNEESEIELRANLLGSTDGFVELAPVGSFGPNPFGLHDVAGNAAEWVLDWYGSYDDPPRRGDGLRSPSTRRLHVSRGGGWDRTATPARSARRNTVPPHSRWDGGVRPARALMGDRSRP